MTGWKSEPWKSDLCECCEDFPTCCFGFWCFPCLTCSVVRRFGECSALSLCDMLGPAALAACGCPVAVPPAALSLRVSIRNRYGIKGSLFEDILVSCFCVLCNWCQMHRELKRRKETPTVITVQPPAIVQQSSPIIVQHNSPHITNHNTNYNTKQFLQVQDHHVYGPPNQDH